MGCSSDHRRAVTDTAVLIAQTRRLVLVLRAMLRTQIEDDRASSQLQASYRECDSALIAAFAVTDELKRRREPAARLSSSGCTQRYGVITRVSLSLKTTARPLSDFETRTGSKVNSTVRRPGGVNE
jgi:hypothetical protein